MSWNLGNRPYKNISLRQTFLPAFTIYRDPACVDQCRPGFFKMKLEFRKVYGRYMVTCFLISILNDISCHRSITSIVLVVVKNWAILVNLCKIMCAQVHFYETIDIKPWMMVLMAKMQCNTFHYSILNIWHVTQNRPRVWRSMFTASTLVENSDDTMGWTLLTQHFI